MNRSYQPIYDCKKKQTREKKHSADIVETQFLQYLFGTHTATGKKSNWKSFASNCMWMFAFHAQFFSIVRQWQQQIDVSLLDCSIRRIHCYTIHELEHIWKLSICRIFVLLLSSCPVRSTEQFYNSFFTLVGITTHTMLADRMKNSRSEVDRNNQREPSQQKIDSE